MPTSWTLSDPVDSTSYTFAISPVEAGTLTYAKSVREQSTLGVEPGVGPRTLILEGPEPAQKLEFSGTLLSEAQLNALSAWWAKRRRVLLTDDLSRSYWVYLVSFTPTREWAPNDPWLHRYKMSAIVLEAL